MDMDFHAMKRKKLQSLCKKHGIPANLKNIEMAERLFLVFKGKENEDPVSCQLTFQNAETIDLVSPSPGLEERTNFSSKVSEGSVIKMNVSPETREDFGICGVEGDSKVGLDKEQVGDRRKGLNSSSTVHVVSLEEFGHPLAGGEVHNLDEPICDIDAVYNVGNGRFEVDTMCIDSSAGVKGVIEKANVTVEQCIDEVHPSRDVDIQEKVTSGTATRNADICEARFVSSPRLSPTSETMVDFSATRLKISETKVLQPERKLSSETVTVDAEICGVEENVQVDVNKEQVDGNKNVEHVARCAEDLKDEDLVQLTSEEFGNNLVEEEVKKGEESNPLEYASENGKGRDEGEVQKSDDYICAHDALHNVEYERSGPMCLDTSIDAMDTDGKTNLSQFIEEVRSSTLKDSDGTPVQLLPNEALREVKFSDPYIHEMVTSGNAAKNADAPRKIISSPTSERVIGFSPKMQNNSETGFSPKMQNNSETKLLQSGMKFSPGVPRVDIAICDAEVSLEVGVNNDQVYDNQEVMHAAPDVIVMNTEDLVHVASEEFGNHLVEEEVEELGDKKALENFCENGEGNEAVKQGDIYRPQEESGYDLVEEVQKSNGSIFHGGLYTEKTSESEVEALSPNDTSIAAEETVEKTNISVEHCPIDVSSIGFKHSDGTPDKFPTADPPSEVNSSGRNTHQMVASDAMDTDGKTSVNYFIDGVRPSAFNDSDGTQIQFLPTGALSEVKCCDPNIHEMVVIGNVTSTADTSQMKLASSRDMSSSPTSERMIGFSLKQPNNSETKLSQFEMEFFPEVPRVDIAICDVEESLHISVNKEQVYDNEEVNTEDLVSDALEEIGNHSAEGEIEKFGDENNLELFCENGKGIDEAVRQCVINSPQKESGYHLVGEVEKSDDNNIHGELYIDQNGGSEVDAMCLHDTSIAKKDTIEKTNGTVEHSPVDVPLASFKYSDGTRGKFRTSDPPSEVNSSGLNLNNQILASVTCEERLQSLPRTGLNVIADPEECIGFSPNDLEVSAFDPTILGDAATCVMEESMEIDKREKEYSEEALHMDLMEECNSVQREDTKLFGNFDVSGIEAAKDINQDYIEMDTVSLEKCFQNEFESIDDGSAQNSNEKADESVSMLQPSDMKSCTSNLYQMSALGTFQENLESPLKFSPIASLDNKVAFSPKLFESSVMKTELKMEKKLAIKHARDVLGATDMKENVKTAKKEQVGMVISKNTFSKRQPLQDLQQN